MWYYVVMGPDSELGKLIIKQSKLINALAGIVADQSMIIDELLPKCQHGGCTEPGTMKLKDTMVVMCDRHTSEVIFKAKTFDQVNEQEIFWSPVPNAQSIRNINEYVRIMKSMIVTEDEVQ